ncbi:FkbM family methyltransferase [Nitratidesulfovibrio liaohensis]|uniref:FkbM family methyltransferase n=1 Tax=Nitratidesulfovibrio liaohensis TaxID=2604158 RepID=A0ABY9R3C7_9BACT|nr:FkbM family methyltransferase [Nitratidesulfovibrio liaohensis]WMW66263.1 FkbM family methyltransferase [Nitratidesulfovibrio liaohensis]
MLSTSHKVLIARALSAVVLSVRYLCGLSAEVVTTRRGLTWSLDLKEGIDLAIYVLGGFELGTLRRYAQLIKPGDVVFDIGANVGAHTLPLAQLVGVTGRVYSFEPTAYAFAKQQANIALNPPLVSRISAHQMMLMADESVSLPESVYSSWPLEGAADLHGKHHGRLMGTHGAVVDTLDSFVLKAGIEHVDFIKLDVDGNENDVLAGAKVVLEDSKPRIMLELAPYVYGSEPHKFDGLLDFLWGAGYKLSDMKTGRLLPQNVAGVRRLIPNAGGLNVLAGDW